MHQCYHLGCHQLELSIVHMTLHNGQTDKQQMTSKKALQVNTVCAQRALHRVTSVKVSRNDLLVFPTVSRLHEVLKKLILPLRHLNDGVSVCQGLPHFLGQLRVRIEGQLG